MPLPTEQFLKRLAVVTDPDSLCEFLNIESKDIIERFDDLIEQNMDKLREEFDVDFAEDEDSHEDNLY
jgi:hypothetical protein